MDRAHAALDEVVNRAGTALNGELNSAAAQLSNIVSGALQGLQAALDKEVAAVQSTIAALDGWTVEITIPSITLRLSGPGRDREVLKP